MGSVIVDEMVVECHYFDGVKRQVFCALDWQNKVHMIFKAAGASSITVWVYGLRQQTTTNSYFLLASINGNYHSISLTDTIPPAALTSQPIIIRNQ